MIFGAHVSAAGGVGNALPKAKALGITAIQIFASPPQSWLAPKTLFEDAKTFGQAARAEGITHIFFHSIYLINLASDISANVEKSKTSLIAALNLNAVMKGDGVIFHTGSAKSGMFDDVKESVIKNINAIIATSDPKSTLIIETNAGSGNNIGDTFEEIKTLIDGVKDKSRIGVCVDTAHTYASGYDLVGKGPKVIMADFDRIVGLKYLKAVHCNDSKTGLNSRVDRHANIGQGQLGDEVFKQLLHLPELKDIPFILEVPGIDGKSGPDKANVETLKMLAQ